MEHIGCLDFFQIDLWHRFLFSKLATCKKQTVGWLWKVFTLYDLYLRSIHFSRTRTGVVVPCISRVHATLCYNLLCRLNVGWSVCSLVGLPMNLDPLVWAAVQRLNFLYSLPLLTLFASYFNIVFQFFPSSSLIDSFSFLTSVNVSGLSKRTLKYPLKLISWVTFDNFLTSL